MLTDTNISLAAMIVGPIPKSTPNIPGAMASTRMYEEFTPSARTIRMGSA